MDTLGKYSVIYYMENNLLDFLFCTPSPLEKGVNRKWKELAPLGANAFLLEQTSTAKECKKKQQKKHFNTCLPCR